MKSSIEIEAEKLDAKLKLDDQSRIEEAKRLKEYRRNLAKFNAWAIRTEENPPTEWDINKLSHCMHYFKI